MSLVILFHFLCAQHILDINISIIRSLQLCCNYAGRFVLGSMCVGNSVWYPCSIHTAGETCNMDTTPTQPHWISNTHQTKKKTTNVVIQQHSCKLMMMDILMSETCWAYKKWNKIASDIKLVFYSSAIIQNI